MLELFEYELLTDEFEKYLSEDLTITIVSNNDIEIQHSIQEYMKMEKKKVCGTCKHSKSEVPFGEFYCDNEESDCYQCECMYDDYCIDYEEEQ